MLILRTDINILIMLPHTRRSIVLVRVWESVGNVSQAKSFRKHTTELRSWFYKRRYPKSLVEKEMGKVKFSGYTKRNKIEKKDVVFVITYHSSLKNLGKTINQSLSILRMNEEVKSLFRLAPMISLRYARRLSSYLVWANIYLLEMTVGSVEFKGKWRQTCHNVKNCRNVYQYNHWKIF